MAEQSLAELPKTTLLARLQSQITANKRARGAAEAIGEKVQEVLGSATAAATGAAIGFAEVNWADEKGPLSLGPVELPLAVAAAATALNFFGFNPAGQMTYIAAGAAGAYGAGRGRAFAIKRKEEQAKKEGGNPKTGWDDSDEADDAERAFIDS
jgi:hypothetical protein